MKSYYLIGIGGIGMCGLAQVFAHEGISVSGSDRSYDRGENLELFNKLKKIGVHIYPQDGSGINKEIDKVIISRAVEDNNPDLVTTKRIGIPVSYRQDELKCFFREKPGIAVAGTSGKTTVVGMIGCIFNSAGKDITVINGGFIRNYITKNNLGNIHFGRFPYLCIETDESEGDLKGYFPDIGVITNIGSDHMPHKKTTKVYNDFAKQTKNALILGENINIPHKNKTVFSISMASDINLFPCSSVFRLDSQRFKLNVPGIHNIYNALAAIAVSQVYGISLKETAGGLERFKGIKKRFEVISKKNGIKIIDDYAHNPSKIRAALEAAHLGKNRVIAVYQPHGYTPTRMFLNELAEVLSENLERGDLLFIPEIYYAGGSVKKDISSKDLVSEIKKRNKNLKVEYAAHRDSIKSKIRRIIKRRDTVIVMGARDQTLSSWTRGLLV